MAGAPPDHTEMDGYPKENFDEGRRFTATRKLLCAWDDRYDLRDWLMSWPPHTYPYNLLWTHGAGFDVRARAVALEPHGGIQMLDAYLAKYAQAILTVTYASPTTSEPIPHPNPAYASNPANAISEEFFDATSNTRLDPDNFEDDAGGPIPTLNAPELMTADSLYVFTRYFQTSVPQEAVDWKGACNSDDVTPVLYSGITFPAYTLLYLGFETGQSVMNTGATGIDIRYTFQYRAATWRKWWNPKTEAYETPIKKGGGAYASPPAQNFSSFYVFN